MPCTTRKAISSPMELAWPHSADPRVNNAIDSRYSRFGPRRRAAQAETGITAASAKR